MTECDEKFAEEQVRKSIDGLKALESRDLEARTPTDRVVDSITGFCGRIAFLWVHVTWFGAWMVYNSLPHLPRGGHFDPYPWPLLLMIVNLESIFLSTFILISQNRQSRLTEKRNEIDLHVNLVAERENVRILLLLESLHAGLSLPVPGDRPAETLVDKVVAVIEAPPESARENVGTGIIGT